MAVFYLDTSVILKRFRTEHGTEVITELYEQLAPRDVLLTSHFTCLEFESVAARAVKGRLIAADAYNGLLGGFARDIGEYVMLLSVGSDLVNQAIEVARDYALRAPDAIHVAAAKRGNHLISSGTFVFVTSDKELFAASSATGLTTLDPESEGALEYLRDLRRGESTA
jgi:predicted nucleic acid-binding protein